MTTTHLLPHARYRSPAACYFLGTVIAAIGLGTPPAIAADLTTLDFTLPIYRSPVVAVPVVSDRLKSSAQPRQAPQPLPQSPASSPDLDHLFAGGSDSLVARAVGTAEGTRTPTGDHTPAYYGHIDPGNGVWNLGSFSYQHGATSPEEADRKQLARLRSQATQIQQQATTQGMTLSVEETLNGIDLANQAPLAALAEDGGNYIDRLQQAYHMGLRGDEAVLWARTYAYVDPETDRWDAPGLGNDPTRITNDQARRLQAITKAIAAYHQPQIARKPEQPPTEPIPQPDRLAVNPPPTPNVPPSTLYSSPSTLYSSPSTIDSASPVEILVPGELDRQTAIANQIIFQDLPATP